ncbi:MAG: cytochrome c oxidase subunit 3 [Fimbriimonadales bacterium]|mgnify:CR=1 FL=1|jgi:cytochrome c oxidase subunit 3|nr:cytochrome c oxidase subunit 3 [Fimbriimonadales bacterium]CUU11023.1 cytochrome c oxidase subunit 3 [Armatimonadetes bacterium GBS]CUU35594.1 cytochrome c oxidase subunit 3 [Armatimonadetes bacterium GXS]CUU38444.1 cytochrome c oxidase subunit 3 [Armatimonadetes bacterium DC]GBC89555.1 Quinol oxidase subunit 3 [bacterium HR14]
MARTKVRPKIDPGSQGPGTDVPLRRYGGGDSGGAMPDPASSARLGMYIFLAAILMMFGAIGAIFLYRLPVRNDFPFTVPPVSWVSTAVILISSIFCQHALNSARQNRLNGVRVGLTLTLALGVLFLSLQGVSWVALAQQIQQTGNNIFTGLFYVFTALHGAHLLGGLVFLSYLLFMALRRTVPDALKVEMGTLYWHFMGVLWTALFALMLVR